MVERKSDRQVTNEALNRMVGREFDLFEFVLEKAIVRREMEEEAMIKEEAV